MKTRQIGAVAGALVISAMLAACGSSSAYQAPYTALTPANFAAGIGAALKNASSVHVSIAQPSQGHTADLDMGFQSSAAMQMSITTEVSGKPSTIVVRMIGSMMYLQLPPSTPPGKWAQFNTSALPSASAEQYKRVNPQDFGDQFQKGVSSIKYVGPAQINGEQVEQYTVVVKASSLSSSLTQLISQAGTSSNALITEQVYVNHANLLQRISMALPASVGSTVMDFSKWNVPLAIAAPAKAEIINPGK